MNDQGWNTYGWAIRECVNDSRWQNGNGPYKTDIPFIRNLLIAFQSTGQSGRVIQYTSRAHNEIYGTDRGQG